MSNHHHFSNQTNTAVDVAPGAHGTGGPADPRALGLVKAAYGVNETIDLLSIGRSSLYAAVNRGELTPVKFGKKTLFYAADLAAFLTKLRELAGTKPRVAPSGDLNAFPNAQQPEPSAKTGGREGTHQRDWKDD